MEQMSAAEHVSRDATRQNGLQAGAFSAWTRWTDRASLPGLRFPGVYVIAAPEVDITAEPFSWRADIVYVGMSNSRGGVGSRLGQFESTLQGRMGHGGAQRLYRKHGDCSGLPAGLFVAVRTFECSVTSDDPDDLRAMGCVAKCEYDCFAEFAEAFGRLPEFNDKARSPKYLSLIHI